VELQNYTYIFFVYLCIRISKTFAFTLYSSLIYSMQHYPVHTFPNGIRFIHLQVPHTKIAHCGFILDIGSRHEEPHQLGLAHFWEHMAFKGTQKRSAFQIINSLEALGGELNAYTTKEKICFYASVLQTHYAKAVDLLTDITFNSIFPEKELKKEKGVILEEMAMYQDSPEDAIQDDFDDLIFRDHSLGNNILGSEKSVNSFQKTDFEDFVKQNLDTSRIILSSVSNMSFAAALKVAEKHLAHLPQTSIQRQPNTFSGYKPKSISIRKPIQQAHCAIGREAYSLYSPKRVPFFMLNQLLGGSAMTSRLNMSLRERNGLVYSVESSYANYLDTGLWAVFFATEPKRLEKAKGLVFKELKKLREQKLSVSQLHSAKQQLMGQLAMSEENYMSFMLMMGKSLLDVDKVESLEEIFVQVEAVNAHQILEVANEIFEEKSLTLLEFLPEK
jgi:predicted Zn-dependent peptidase